jgi:uncharacterized protein YjdB
MKKIYLLALLCCLSGVTFAQFTTTVIIWSTGTLGSWVSGNTSASLKSEDTITTTSTTQVGYAVFDLSVIPRGAGVSTALLGYYQVSASGGTGTSGNIHGIGADLSGFASTATPAALFDTLNRGTLGVFTGTIGSGSTGYNAILAGAVAARAFFNGQIGNKVTLSWTGGGPRIYNIKGETGVTTSTSTVNHAPYLQIGYCAPPTSIVTGTSSSAVCAGSPVTLTVSSVSGMIYHWSGPGGFTATGASVVASPTVTGAFTVTAIQACGSFSGTATAVTSTVTVNPSPITGPTLTCVSNTAALANASPGGVWSSSNTSVASINTSGTVSGIAVGTAVITYRVPTSGCFITAPMTVILQPGPITGPAVTCVGSSVTLSSPPTGGMWSSSNTSVATIGSGSGIVSGVAAGTTTITYTNPVTNCFITSLLRVNAPPGATTGPTQVCPGSSITLSNPMPGGVWSSTAPATATVDPVRGVVTGVIGASGSLFINYTIAGCVAAGYGVTVNPTPAPISGITSICQGYLTPLTNVDTGGVWSTSNALVATIDSFGGVVTAIAAGTAIISYTLPTSCFNTILMTINLVPDGPLGPDSVCIGSTIALTDATPGGSWITGDASIATVDPAGVVTGVSTGVVFISYALVTGCLNAKAITVSSPPPAISGTFTICQNASTTLANAEPGGVWASSNSSIASIGSSTGVMTGVAAGAAVVTYTVLTQCYVTESVIIDPAPLAVITPGGPTTFCAGGSVMLNASPGGSAYQWYSSGTPIAGATSSSITVGTTGSYSVRVTNRLSCSAMSPTVTVSAGIDPVITSSGANAFCAGDHVTLSINSGGAVGMITYQWAQNGIAIPAATSVSYLATTSGIYTASVTLTGTSGSCMAVTSVPAMLTTFPLPTPIASYDGTTLSTSNTFNSYQWYVNNASIPGATSNTYKPVVNGSYRVRVSDGNGCVNNSLAVDIFSVGVAQVNNAGIAMYPNPVCQLLHIVSSVKVHAQITGVEGRLLIDVRDSKDVDLSKLANGIYMISLYSEIGERLLIQKLIKE